MAEINLVAPIHNETNTILKFVDLVSVNLKKITENYKIILIDDGSTDNSWQIIEELSQKNNNLLAIKLTRNFGHHYALAAGLQHAKGDWVIVMDSDLQDDPNTIEILFQEALKGFEIVFVNRINRPESNVYKISQRIFYFALRKLSGIDFNYKQANYSIISRKVLDKLNNSHEQFKFYPSSVKWLGYKTGFVESQHLYRYSGKSSYNFRKRLNLALDIILSFSNRPLFIGIYFGLFVSLLSLFFIVWIIIGAIFGKFVVLGWPSLMASIFFLGGCILTIIGVIGVYIGKIFSQVKKRPSYIVEKILNV